MKERLRRFHSPVGLRTLKTAVAVTAAILLVERYGTSADELLFGVMGAFYAMEPTVKASVRGCAAQFSGVAMGVLLGVAMRALEIPDVVASGVGIVAVITAYQLLRFKQSPFLPCLVLVTICTDPGLNAVRYGLERLWNTTLGMGVGIIINTLVFPYDNSRKIQQIMYSLDEDLIQFLKDRFDGDDHLPETDEMSKKIESLEGQLAVFADQRLLLHRRRQKRTLAKLQGCEDTARSLLLEVEVLRSMDHIGRLNQENREALRLLGANVSMVTENRFLVDDLVVNYHVSRVLQLRQKLKEELSGNTSK